MNHVWAVNCVCSQCVDRTDCLFVCLFVCLLVCLFVCFVICCNIVPVGGEFVPSALCLELLSYWWIIPLMTSMLGRVSLHCVDVLTVYIYLRSAGLSVTIFSLFICPITIAYSMRQIINSVCICHMCVCLSVCLSVCPHSHGRIYWSIFTKSRTEVTIPNS